MAMAFNSGGLGLASRRAGPSMLGGSGVRSRSANAGAFLACEGGLVSLSAGGSTKSRKYGACLEKMTKEAYASALEEQIATRKLQDRGGHDEMVPLLTDDHGPTRERTMGTRNGGPMAPACKEDYASDLRAQIAAREAQRLADCSTREPEVAGLEGLTALGLNAPQVAALGGRSRRHGAPALPSKESYATELREQMVKRSVNQATEASTQMESADGQEDAIDDILNGKGRRHNGPMVLPPKAGYAADLREQMTMVNAKRAADKDHMLSIATEGLDGVFAGQAEKNRGKRPAAKIDQVSSASLGLALQEQMEEKASLRAGNAFHTQTGASVLPAAEASLQGMHGGRKRIPLPSTNKAAYAQALEEQMAQRSEEKPEGASDVFNTAFVGGPSKQWQPGRRHAGQMPIVSKADLRIDLQRQMAEKEAQRNEQSFHRQATTPRQPEGFSQELPTRMASGTGDSLERLLSEHAVGQVC